MKHQLRSLIFTGALIASLGAAASPVNPKYGPDASPLSRLAHQAYFQKSHAPDFWALIPFYVHQENESSCSAAALITVLNGARRNHPLTSQDELLTHKSLTEKFTDAKYRASVSGDKAQALKLGTQLGVPVDRLAEVLAEAAKNLKIALPVIKLIHTDLKNVDASRKEFHTLLVQNERSADDFIMINYVQGMLTGDPEGMVGHIAAIGAYDEKNKLVLILDPDRQWYEPYWSPEDKVFDAIADSRGDAHPGYVYFKYQ